MTCKDGSPRGIVRPDTMRAVFKALRVVKQNREVATDAI
jgi:hypothetical protein